MFKYLQSKKLNGVHRKKTSSEKVCSPENFMKLLAEVDKSRAQFNQNADRDYALIYMSYWMGLRIGEACILERRHFQRLEVDDIAVIPTLKQKERIPYFCSACGRRSRVCADRIGDLFECPRCLALNEVTAPKGGVEEHVIPEKEMPFIEPTTQMFILSYIEKMPPQQTWLFPSRKGGHISESFANRIFSTYLMNAGLPTTITFHSLRHGRGQMLYSMLDGDLIAVRDALRHRNTKTTEIYASLDLEKKAEYKRIMEAKAQKMFKKKETA